MKVPILIISKFKRPYQLNIIKSEFEKLIRNQLANSIIFEKKMGQDCRQVKNVLKGSCYETGCMQRPSTADKDTLNQRQRKLEKKYLNDHKQNRSNNVKMVDESEQDLVSLAKIAKKKRIRDIDTESETNSNYYQNSCKKNVRNGQSRAQSN